MELSVEKAEKHLFPPREKIQDHSNFFSSWVECISLNCPEKAEQREWKIRTDDTCIALFCMSGHLNLSVYSDKMTLDHSIPAGRFCLYYCPKEGGRISCQSDECTNMLRILSPRAILLPLLGENPVFFPSLENKEGMAPLMREITPPMTRVIEILWKTYFKKKKHLDLFTFSKSLELLWLCFGSCPLNIEHVISENDHKAVKKAMLILENNLESPPGLSDLANMVGMSPSKLKKIFPKAVGMPPYEYLRKKRMEKAMYLLNSGRMNVTEVALEVGYSSFSHFTKVFFRNYKITPSQLKKIN
ncbi:MAG: AraC family transcriptional regulator [Desulfobacteraceae bacterium]|jgi:AraC-like DNA-binding protein